MLRTLTIWELWLLAAFALVVGQELVALLMARRRGETRNLSRVVTFASLLVLTVVHGLLTLRLLPSGDSAEALRRLTGNWGYLVLGVMITVVLAWELASLIQARIAGLTRNTTRLAALMIAAFLLLVLLGISQVKWELYVQQLEDFYAESVQADG